MTYFAPVVSAHPIALVRPRLSLVRQYREWQVESLAMPALGCGHGGLNWSDVRPLIERHLGNLDIDIEVYELAPAEAPDLKGQSQDQGATKPENLWTCLGNRFLPVLQTALEQFATIAEGLKE